MLGDSLREFTTAYHELRGQSFRYSDQTKILTQDIPKELYSLINLSPDEFLIKGSVGNGKWSDVAWVCIMHLGITNSTQHGYYVAALLSSDLSKLFITVGLGWTQFAEQYGSKDGRVMVQEYAKKLASYLSEAPDEITGIIDLGATTQRSKGYELSNIVSIEHDITSVTEDALLESFERMLEHYKTIRDEYGADLFYDSVEAISDDKEIIAGFKSKVKKLSASVDKGVALEDLLAIANTEPPARKKVFTSQIIRNKAFADYVKNRADYVCEICIRKPFSKRNGKPYAEADHIDRLDEDGKDHPDNMRCLCPQCHRVVTYGSEEEVMKLGDQP